MSNLPQAFRCLLSFDPDTSLWIGHCLDLDLVTSAKTEEDAWANLKKVILAHVEACLTHFEPGMARYASDDKFEVFGQLLWTNPEEEIRRDKISLNLSREIQGVKVATPHNEF